jgi:16S rRNA G966 N2-methylase RsmD
MNKENKTFETNYVYDKKGNYELFSNEIISNDKPVTCLGLTFENEDARRAHFTEELRKKLQDPEFRKIEGFPIGEDEDILKLSDPPYYTACPNPWIQDFVEEWEREKPEKPADYKYHREPFAADVSEGRSGLFYDAHSYHTKVPHKAIMRYILHYTEPGDIVFDGFCGTGMTGVAAQMCGDREEVTALGYKVETDGTILQKELDERGKDVWKPFSKLGARKVVLNDLSPAATFIAYNYNAPVDIIAFEQEAQKILDEVEKECGWMYETLHTDRKSKGKINYTIWSDVFVCPECNEELVFWEVAVNKEAGKVLDTFACSKCKAQLTKRKLERSWVNKFDMALKDSIKQAKQVPVLINYSYGKKRYEKKPDAHDLAIIEKIEHCEIPNWFPTERMMEGSETRRNDPIGLTHVHHFYTKRNLWVLHTLRAKILNNIFSKQLSFLISSYDLTHSTLMSRIIFKSKSNKPVLTGYQSGTLYVSSLPVEKNLIEGIQQQKLPIIKKSLEKVNQINLISCVSTNNLSLKDNSIDYLFFDPPFGSNLNYSELNFLWESWLKVWTNNKPEAIENSAQNKGITEYRALMLACFKEAHRTLKPGGWMTVEFSNTKASVWNSIQTAIAEAGFILANVSALDKQQGSFKAVTTPTAVTQDLVISAYKPNGGFEDRFETKPLAEETVWDFVRTHLKYLPVIKQQGLDLVAIPEREPRILYDQVVSYYVRKGYNVPIDSKEFQIGLKQRFSERDGMYFLPDQVLEYDRKTILGSGKPIQLSIAIKDEASAIAWLRIRLSEKPRSFQDINPLFMQEISNWSRNEVSLELSTLLEQSFLLYDGKGAVPSQIHSYLSTNWKDMRNLEKDDPNLVEKAKNRWYVPDPNKAGDLEQVREKALLKEFEDYKKETKKLKIFRLEAVRAGFKRAWQQKDYKTIINIAEKIPNNILEEDPKLLMWYDQAITRLGDSL